MTDATRTGWQCPGCLTNYSPDVQSCSCSVKPETVTPNTWALPPGITITPCAPVAPSVICTCPQAWGGITAPSACPLHGQIQILRVWC